MTDLELIQVLREKSAGELAPAEIDAIRARWTQSPELRQALVEHLRLESQLIGALGPVHLDVDTILKRASEQRRANRIGLPRWSWLVGLCLLLAAGMTLFRFVGMPQPADRRVETDSTAAAQAVDSENEQSRKDDVPDHMDQPSADTAIANSDAAQPNDPSSPTAVTMPDPKPIPGVIDVAANEPWSAALSRETAPWAANSPKLATDYKSSGHDEFSDTEAKRWLAQVDGQPYGWSTDSIGNPVRRIARFQGLAKLRAPWPDDAVLRLTPFEVTDLTLYFWRGPTGIALRFHTRREPHLWAAFEITRENSSPKPTRWGLLTTDNGSYIRSTAGTIDIRQQDGDLVMARGGIILMSVPFVGPPIEVFVEGQLRLRGLSMCRSAPFLRRPESPHRAIVAGPAAALPWAMSVESPASLMMNNDGSVSLTVDSRDKIGLTSLPFGWQLATMNSVHSTGLFEVIVNVESADPGTGIFLGDRDGRPLHQLGFFRDNASQQTTFGILRPGEVRADANYNPNDFPPPYLAKPGWLKLVAGLGTLHISSSGDGRNWGHVVESPGRDLPGAVGSVGLFGLHGPTPRTIRVRHVQVRELTGITSLAATGLRSRVAPFQNDDFREMSAFRHRVLDTLPADTDPTEWFNASAVVALAQGPPKEFGLGLLRQLVGVGMRSKISFERKRQLLDEACSLCDLFDEGSAKSLGVWYEVLGWQLAESGDPAPLDQLRPAWLWSPIWTNSKMKYVWERLHSHQILHAVYRRDWNAAWTSAQSAFYWNVLPHPDQRPTERGEELDRHSRWAKALIAEVATNLDDGTAGVMPAGWRHPLIPALNKEAYNVRAELQSALIGQNYEDACRIVMSIAEHDGPGLLPDAEDRHLYVSMQTAIWNARNGHPDFAQTMSEKFEPLGKIRVTSARNRRDTASLHAATLQFMGTDAAREAQLSLGEIALSVGQFETAEQHFEEALVDAGQKWRATLEPRLRLAQALAGRIAAAKVVVGTDAVGIGSESLEFNGTAISSSDFEALVKDLAARPSTSVFLTESTRPTPTPFVQAAYKLESRAQFDGHPGNNPGRWEYRFGDPFGRQLSVVSDELRIYVSNRFQVNAYSNTDGRQLWAQGLGSEQGESYAMPFAPMKPLIAGDRLFVRRLTKAGAELACLKADDGQVVWHQRPSNGLLTDPVIWNGRLFATVLTKLDEDVTQVEATWFDSTNGDVLSTRPLFRLREAPERQFSGQMTISDRVAICTVAGTTACFDSRGEMRWLKRHTWLQKPTDELAEDHRVVAPVVKAGCVIATMPGVREVSCLDLDSGRTVWERPITDLRGLIDVNDSRVLVDTVAGLVALDAKSGQIAWSRPIETRLEGLTISGQTLMVARRGMLANNRSKPILLWLDIKTGEELGQSLVDVADREECQLGPMFSAGGKWWSFVGQTWKEPKRELHEFVAAPLAAPNSFVDETLQTWSPESLDGQFAEIESVVPSWFPVADYRERLVVHPGEIRGETFTLVSKLDAQHSVRWTRRLRLIAGQKPSLRLRVGNQPGQKWKLTVRTARQILMNQEIEDANGTNGWRDVTIDLSPLSGQDVSVYLIQATVADAAADALWKRAELIRE